jgi:hypothetical protein
MDAEGPCYGDVVGWTPKVPDILAMSTKATRQLQVRLASLGTPWQGTGANGSPAEIMPVAHAFPLASVW